MISKVNELKVLGDHRGKLVVLESNRDVPFDIKRVFYIYGTQEGVPRGKHAHFKTKQLLMVLKGSCTITLDNGKEKESYLLDKPELSLFQDSMVWGTMHDFSEDCVLLVLSDMYYDEKDYIRNYEDFLKVIDNDT